MTTLITDEEAGELDQTAREALAQLSRVVLDGVKPPPGPYAFFHHVGHATTRVSDIRRILHRLFEQRQRLTALAVELDGLPEYRDWKGKGPYPEPVQVLLRKQSELTEYMKQDLETLYIFGGILLDQWALVAIAVGALDVVQKHPFVEFVEYFDKGRKSVVLDIVWSDLKPQLVWLHYQLRFYRNRFIVHANRPWQRGTIQDAFGARFNLWIPSPPGWQDDEKLNREILSIANVRDTGKSTHQLAGQTIERLFMNIETLPDRQAREHAASLFGKVGGATPTFQIIGERLLRLLVDGTDKLTAIVVKDPSSVNLGKPFRTSDKLL